MYNVLFLYSWKGGNGFSTRMVPKLQITSGEARHKEQGSNTTLLPCFIDVDENRQ
jgi:hypothetical protein